nr:hypothetical protein CFP56_71924 [Quercus suber]
MRPCVAPSAVPSRRKESSLDDRLALIRAAFRPAIKLVLIHLQHSAHEHCLGSLSTTYSKSFIQILALPHSAVVPTMSGESSNEAEIYKRLSTLGVSARTGEREGLRTTPLLSLAVKDHTVMQSDSRYSGGDLNTKVEEPDLFNQYAVLGYHAGTHKEISEDEPILMNVDAPNSTFICGSQGSGKSYTLSCMLENCLIADKRIGRVSLPVAGIAFHYDHNSAGSVAEAAYLCSMNIPVNVLVSRSNENALRTAYGKLPNARTCLKVAPLLFSSQDLSIERMLRLMAFADKEASMPLYMSVAMRVLRQMAISTGGDTFSYQEFKQALEKENLTKEQLGPLNLRLELLESFLDIKSKISKSLLSLQSGSLTIIDLSDPFMDPATACVLFDICLSLIEENRPSCGLVVALDEAHKYMTTSPAASNFTERLLGTIREQRHNGTRVIIATQEPTISAKLLDLCTVSIVHRFTSPAWFSVLRDHLGAASRLVSTTAQQDLMFEQIMDLGVGESFLFAPSAYLCLTPTGIASKLGKTAVRLKTRTRLGMDGGMSVLITAQASPDMPVEATSDDIVSSSKGTHGKGAEQKAKTPTRTNVTSPSRKVIEREPPGGVTIVHDSNGTKSALSRERPHLALICCECKAIVIMEFHKEFPAELNKDRQDCVKDGIAYATCVRCQLKVIAEDKKQSKRFDMTKAIKFHKGEIDIDEELCTDLTVSLRLALGDAVMVLLRGGRPCYIFARIAQRNLNNGGVIWSAKLQKGCTDLKIREHEDGVFFKSSLQPNESG